MVLGASSGFVVVNAPCGLAFDGQFAVDVDRLRHNFLKGLSDMAADSRPSYTSRYKSTQAQVNRKVGSS
jgi:hypothetical protein